MIAVIVDNQFGAALRALKYCMDRCPDAEWQRPHGDYPFSQVVFHALFYTDFYLSDSIEDFKAQAFHQRNPALFEGYEELADEAPVNLYGKDQCRAYLDHCAESCARVFLGGGDDRLAGRPLLRPELGTRLELHLYSLRHIQHHAAQLGLRLQLITGEEMPWFRSGWKDLRP